MARRVVTPGRVAVGLIALLIPVIAVALLRSPKQPAPRPVDPIPDLQKRIDSGSVKLQFQAKRGYLDSLLKALNIPLSSQVLVFARNSAQLGLISPERPRAIYFNDDVYVGWVQGGTLEIASVDSKLGPAFYTLSQDPDTPPRMQHQSEECTVCHDTFQADTPVPRLLILSVLPDKVGTAIKQFSMVTNDQSPFAKRWGGWYVTGTHGDMRHMGNTTAKPLPDVTLDQVKNYVEVMDRTPGANMTDLSTTFDTKAYPTPHSDIVALMVLGHQTHIHNLITSAVYEYRATPTPDVAKDTMETLLRAMLFTKEVPLTGSIEGTSGFAAEFSKQGPQDRRGRGLHQLDLKTRLLRYPLSYLIYSSSFDEMPEPLRKVFYERLQSVLNGGDSSGEFARISAVDRQALLEILQETKPEFAKIEK